MSEGNYKVVCTSLEIKDPEPLVQTYISSSVSANNNYQFEMATKTQTKKDMGLTRTVYHGQSIIKNNGTANCIPFFQYTSSTDSEIVTIGKIILEITDVTGVNNSTNNQLFQLIGTQQSVTEITNTLVSASTDKASTEFLLGAKQYTSNFYLDGLAASKTKKWIIDLNKAFTSTETSATTSSYISLGLLFKTAPTATTIKIDAYTEVIS